MPLSLKDIRHLDAADSWLERGDYVNCFHEVERMDYENRDDSRVLALRWRLYDKSGLHVSAAGIALEIQRRFPHEVAGYVWRAVSLNKLGCKPDKKGLGKLTASQASLDS
jgi:hypothetical protein